MRTLLTVNSGSSSLKFALFSLEEAGPARLRWGKFERIGVPGASLSVGGGPKGGEDLRAVAAPTHTACIPVIRDVLKEVAPPETLAAVAHRVVHGGARTEPAAPMSAELLEELRAMSPFAPDHLPNQIALIEEAARRFPGLPQFACFDTAFHRDLPRAARLLPIPLRYEKAGVRRHGYHGLSFGSLMGELERTAGREAAAGRVVLAHLGSGASLAAVRGGKCLDTTMAFSPASGLVMSTRSGDLDPGLMAYLARAEGMIPEAFHRMVTTQSGLLGLSESSPDVRDLLKHEGKDPRAADALAVFCHSARKWVGAMAAVLGGLDTLVFSGGIGENSHPIRERICQGLEFLGVALDPDRNRSSAPLISREGSKAAVRVIRTDEEAYMAGQALARLR